MESLQDKIISIEKQMEDNETTIAAIKAEADTKSAGLKEENKKLAKVVKKLKDTQSAIESIYATPAQSE